MQHYVVYHSVKGMGWSFRDGEPKVGEFGIVTGKKRTILEGSIVWLISGEGTPCDYRLEHWFIVSGSETINGDKFGTRVFGTDGHDFFGGIRINEAPWFEAFHSTKFYSLGLQSLSEEMVENFYSVVHSSGEMTPDDPTTVSQTDAKSGGDEPVSRSTVISERIIRDTTMTAGVKRLYDFYCQVCGIRLETPDGPYAEGAHIKPLGIEHNGPDVVGNILCLCPNDHVLFDNGAFSVNDNMKLVGVKSGRLKVVPRHQIDHLFLAYHRKVIFKKGKTK